MSAAQTGGERELADAALQSAIRWLRSGSTRTPLLSERTALLAALDRGAADARTVAGVVEHKAVLLKAIYGELSRLPATCEMGPWDEVDAQLRAAERAVSALPEQEVSGG